MKADVGVAGMGDVLGLLPELHVQRPVAGQQVRELLPQKLVVALPVRVLWTRLGVPLAENGVKRNPERLGLLVAKRSGRIPRASNQDVSRPSKSWSQNLIWYSRRNTNTEEDETGQETTIKVGDANDGITLK